MKVIGYFKIVYVLGVQFVLIKLY